jgi:hypothetical protein
MSRWPKCFAIVLVICSSAGCKQEPSGPQIIYAGFGISNYVEIGMTAAEVAKRNPDAEFKREFAPGTRFWEKPFVKPQRSEAAVRPRAARAWQFNGQPITWLDFWVPLLPHSLLREGSKEVLFEPQKPVLRQEVINAFGEPDYHIKDLLDLPSLLNRGESVSLTNAVSEQLHYPCRGVDFFLKGGAVTSFSIYKKFNGTNAPARP